MSFLSESVRLFRELGRSPQFLLHLKWLWQNHRFIKRENRFKDSEFGRVMYRGATYCIDCRRPTKRYGLCDDCAKNDQFIVVPQGAD